MGKSSIPTEILIENDFEEKIDRDVFKHSCYCIITLDDRLKNNNDWRNKVIKRIDKGSAEW